MVYLSKVGVLLFLTYFAYRGYEALNRSHSFVVGREAVAMIEEYVKLHDGAWPRSWSDLEKFEVNRSSRSSLLKSEKSFDTLRKIIVCDFTANSCDLARSTLQDFDAIRSTDPDYEGYKEDWEIASLLKALRAFPCDGNSERQNLKSVD